MRDYIRCWDSFERFLAWQIEHCDDRSTIYFASEGVSTGEPELISTQRLRLRQQALQWRYGGVPEEEAEVRPVKIGRCSRDPAIRLQELQVGNYRPLFDICVIPVRDAVAVETELHRAFAEFHIRGEWYAMAPIIHQMIGVLIDIHERCVAPGARQINRRELRG